MRTLDDLLKDYERSLIVGALQRCGGSRSETARALGIRRPRLYYRMRVLGVRPEDVVLRSGREQR